MLRYKHSGLALITALIFLQIIAILGIYAVQSTIFAEKMSRLAWQHNQSVTAAEYVLHLAETQAQAGIAECVIPTTSSNELVSKPLSWWQSFKDCAGNFQLFEYYYVIEKLGEDGCAYIKLANYEMLNKYSANYSRITLLLTDKKNEVREMLQSTLVTLDNARLNCDTGYHPVVLGRQAWRELT